MGLFNLLFGTSNHDDNDDTTTSFDANSRFQQSGETRQEWVERVRALNDVKQQQRDADQYYRDVARKHTERNLNSGERGLSKENAKAAWQQGLINKSQYLMIMNEIDEAYSGTTTISQPIDNKSSANYGANTNDIKYDNNIMTNDGLMADHIGSGLYERDGQVYDSRGRRV